MFAYSRRKTCASTALSLKPSPRLSSQQHRPARPVRIASLLQGPQKPSSDAEDLITVQGFVRSVRRQKKVAFLAISDGSTYNPLQAVVSPELAHGLSTGAAVSVTGKWTKSPDGKQQREELQANRIVPLGHHDSETYPLQKKYHSNDFLRTMPHLRPRTALNSLLLRVRSQAISAITRFFDEEGFVNVHPPLITSSDCEGAGEVFTVSPAQSGTTTSSGETGEQFFRDQKYLTVSTQLHLEALAAAVGRVWTLSPTFRAERSDTPRHLSEFYMLEAEQMFTDNLESVMSVVERLLQTVASALSSSPSSAELVEAAGLRMQDPSDDAISGQSLQHRWQKVIAGDWPRITYRDAIAHLREATKHESFKHNPTWDNGLQAEHEKYLAQTIGNNGPVFVTHYPQKQKAFYMALSPSDQQSEDHDQATVACFDLIVPELCEIAGGSLREHQLDTLLQQGLADSAKKNLEWYIDLRRYGSAPHGGFGLGFDRLLCYLTGISSIRDMAAFPRWYGRSDC